jgi:DNA-binding CsgD family transcriptional regulator/tetratricopeptide (TPR) repeat protein
MPTGQRVQLHAHVAEELERSYGVDASTSAAELAARFNEARSLLGAEKVVKYSMLAGQQAMTTYAAAEAVDQFELALAATANSEDVETADLYFDLGNALNRMGGRPTDVVEALAKAFDIYEARGEAAKAIKTASYGITRDFGRGSPEQAAMCERALDLAEPDSLDAARILNEYGVALVSYEVPERSLAALNRANEIARREEDLFLQAHSLANMAGILLNEGQYEKTAETALQVLDLVPRIESPLRLVDLGLRITTFALSAMGEFEEAKHYLARLIEYDLSTTGFNLAHVDLQFSCLVALAEGKWDEARRIAEHRLADKPTALEFGVDAHIEFMTGATGSPIAGLARFVNDSTKFDTGETGDNALMLAMAGRDLDDADAVGLAQKIVDSDSEDPNHSVHPAVISGVHAVGAIVLGDASLASDLYPIFLPYRQSWTPSSRFIGIDRLLALLAETSGKPELATRHFDESIAFCEKAGILPELARTYCEYVRFRLARPGRIDRVSAIRMIDEGLAVADALGMAPLSNRLELLRDEVMARGTNPVYPNGLTRREVEVLRLVALGRTNREVASELVITENTAARHVANILAKTDSANRVEAAAFAATHDLLDRANPDRL